MAQNVFLPVQNMLIYRNNGIILVIKDWEVQIALRHRLGLSVLPLSAPTVQCGCGATLRRSDTDHAMRCRALAAQLTVRNKILKGILRRAVH
jgi:hypothetical protein